MVMIVADDEAGVIKKLCEFIEKKSNLAIKNTGKFTIGLSGGSLIKYLCTGLPEIKTDWSKWVLFFCDERVVAEDSDDSTFGAYKKDLLPKVPLLESQFVTIKQGVTAAEAAEDYREKLFQHFKHPGLPRFNMLLLGMGPDGHTCSLFPGHSLLDETTLTVASITDSPKPPSERITLTYPVINNAECCIFALSGAGKADMIKRIYKDQEDLPAGRVQPTDGQRYWITDVDGAKLFHSKLT